MGRDKLTSPHTGAVFLHESLQDECRFFIARRLPSQMNPRFAVLLGKIGSPLRSAGKLVGDGENDSGIRVPDIPLGALEVVRRRSFGQQILPSYRPVLGLPALGTPASMRK